MMLVKIKSPNRLNAQADMRVAISNIFALFWKSHKQETVTQESSNWNTWTNVWNLVFDFLLFCNYFKQYACQF